MSTVSVKGDRPLGLGDEDKLGFREVAARIAVSIVDHASDNGLVIGIDGAWGSGKSSLVYLIQDELGKLPDIQRPEVIVFRPWLVGNRDALIRMLFLELSKKLDHVALGAGDATRISVSKAKAAGKALRNFADGLGKAASALELAGDLTGFAPVKWIGKGGKAFGEWAKGKPAEPQLSELKDKLVTALRDLNQKFIITIDDVDRLEPNEVIEILRLARSVADFPNVVYLLCYDSEIVSHSIEEATKVKSGRSYLEKIVQLSVMVPRPEAFQLRQWFSNDLHEIALPRHSDELSRLKIVIDYEGGRQLKTPRAVVRALDAVRFFWPPLKAVNADLADLVWLQLIKDANPALYRWIEEYCTTSAVLSLGTGSIQDTERECELVALHDKVPQGHFDDHIYRHYFADQLLGMEIDHAKDGLGFKLHQRASDHRRDNAIRGSRLASPDHYRLYFALAGPMHALTTGDFAEVWAAAEAGPMQIQEKLLSLHNEQLAGNLGKADMLLERMKGGACDSLSAEQCANLLLAFAHILDEAYRIRAFDRFWVNSLWDRAERAMPELLDRLDDEARQSTLSLMFENGAAVGWLTSILRREIFAHGRYGDRKRPDGDWLLTEEELNVATGLMLARFRKMSPDEIYEGIDGASLLFAWRQAGDEDGPKKLVEKSVETDEGLILALENLTGSIQSSDRGVFSVLKQENMSPFLDFEKVIERLTALGHDAKLGERATRLITAVADGRDY